MNKKCDQKVVLDSEFKKLMLKELAHLSDSTKICYVDGVIRAKNTKSSLEYFKSKKHEHKKIEIIREKDIKG